MTTSKLSLFVSPVDQLNKGKGTSITIPLEELEDTGDDSILLFGNITNEQAQHLKIPFSYYSLLPNDWEHIDDETKVYAFKYQIKPNTELQHKNSSCGQKMLIMKDNCIYLRNGDDHKQNKSKLIGILIFEQGVVCSVAMVLTKTDDEDMICSLIERIKLE